MLEHPGTDCTGGAFVPNLNHTLPYRQGCPTAAHVAAWSTGKNDTIRHMLLLLACLLRKRRSMHACAGGDARRGR